MSNLSPEEIGQLALRFAPEGMLEAPVPFGGGHINDTYGNTAQKKVPNTAECDIIKSWINK